MVTLPAKSSLPTTPSPLTEEEELLERLQVFKIQGRDKQGRNILRIIGKLFPARVLNSEVVKNYLEEKAFKQLDAGPFCVVYVHTHVQRGDNFPGISTLRSIYEALPITVKENLETVYFIHPGLQTRLFFATFGRFLFSGGLYGKLRYINRLEFLWEFMRRGEIEIPEFVFDHDEVLEFHPLMDYGLEGNYDRVYDAPSMDTTASMYSLRCIS
eukprot:TRINITY_DN5838_c1_g1_i1.p1 TRINITY_DN5838_c1_g1~~TRINITY_DN5838_c1_g1_i1.p1  ORF type:complete len:213 (+),score=15.17 TRINITY_DN5838_c1_g1_i1:137-775(+)